jgi:hypothetical protein
MGGDHKCPVCQATFTRPQHVARHMRSRMYSLLHFFVLCLVQLFGATLHSLIWALLCFRAYAFLSTTLLNLCIHDQTLEIALINVYIVVTNSLAGPCLFFLLFLR